MIPNKSFCIIPWIHLYVNTDGKVYPCCISASRASNTISNIANKSITELMNSPFQSQLRLDMLNDVPREDVCSKCNQEDAAGLNSFRTGINRDFILKIAPLIEKTNKSTGEIENPELLNWDFRFSNLCNLRCRTCGDTFSTSIAAENPAVKMKKITWVKDETSIDKLRQHYSSVERIYFAGGEPLIMEEHFTVLKELSELDRAKEISIVYNSNLMNLEYKKIDFLTLWSKFKKVTIGVSLDQIEERAEFVRDQTKWSKIHANLLKLKEFKKEVPSFNFYVAFTLSAFNVFDFPRIHRWFLDNGIIAPREFDLLVNTLVHPIWYDCRIVSNKDKVVKLLQEHYNYLKATYRFDFQALAGVIRHFSSDHPNLTEARDMFKKETARLDALRNQKFTDIFDKEFFDFYE